MHICFMVRLRTMRLLGGMVPSVGDDLPIPSVARLPGARDRDSPHERHLPCPCV
jgi:hypothetical protein